MVLDEVAAKVRECTLCRLRRNRTRAVPGEGAVDADLFLIEEAPGRQEDAAGRPFVGSAGKVLNRALTAARISRKDVFITNLVKCRPPANRAPKADELEACRPYVRSQIEAVRLRVLVTLSSTALRSLQWAGSRLAEVRWRNLILVRLPVPATYQPAT